MDHTVGNDNRDRTRIPVRLQLLEVPVTDLTGRHLDLRATRALGIPSLLALRELRSVARTHLARSADARDPLASPLRAASHAGLPPAVIMTAEYDPLRGDGAAYAARLRAAGVEASAVQYLGDGESKIDTFTVTSVDGENGSGFGVQGAFEGAIQSALHRLLIDPRFLAYINR